VKSIDEAIGWASRIAQVMGDAGIDIRPVTEPWDLGMSPRPPGLTTQRFMALYKAEAASEAGVAPTPEQAKGLGRLIEEMIRAGVLLSTEALQPSSKGARIRFARGKHTVTDGPFTEWDGCVSLLGVYGIEGLRVNGNVFALRSGGSVWTGSIDGSRSLGKIWVASNGADVDVNGGRVYWNQSPDGTYPGCLGSANLDGTDGRCLDDGDHRYNGVRADDMAVYFIRDGEIWRVSKWPRLSTVPPIR
jgi:hypothetical protein